MPANIVQCGDPVLRKVADEVPLENIKTSHIQEIIQLMKDTMHAAPGVGLAAPQIGISLQIAVIEDKADYTAMMKPEIKIERHRVPVPYHVIINPKLTVIGNKRVSFFEGCLSVNNISRITPRSYEVQVEYFDENADKQIITAKGWYARILQHEIDHLNGKLYIDIADERTQIDNTLENRQRWLNATSDEINEYYRQVTSLKP